MNILKKQVSFFKNTKQIQVLGNYPIEKALQYIKEGKFKAQIEKVRAGDKSAKTQLPTIAMHGIFSEERKKDQFIEASGLIILDIDDVDVEKLEEIKEEIMEYNDHVLAAMISPSGNGIKVLYYVSPELVTASNYRQIGKMLVQDFMMYGSVDYLSTTDCLIMTYDPNIQINKYVEPAHIHIPTEEGVVSSELSERDESKDLWDDAQEFFEVVLANNIEEKTNNNFHYIQVAVLDLKKFGFEHPKDDLSFVIDYAEACFKKSSDNKRRFLEVVELSKAYGQTQWAYKANRVDEDFEEMPNYADMYSSEDSPLEDASEITEESGGLIDYETLFNRVVGVVEEGDRVGAEVSLKAFADIFRFKGSGILTITGIPGHGKTEFVDACMLDLARLHGHESIICGFEQTPEEHIVKMARKLVGTDVTCKTWWNENNMPKFKEAYDFITEKIKHIDASRVGGNVLDILDIAAKQVSDSRANGGNPKYLVIDPFNMLSMKGKFNGHEKIEEILRRITTFSHQMGVMVILVAHPFKMKTDEKTGEYNVPDFYSVKGSSAFFEMSYHGLVVYRSPAGVMVRVLKVKQNNLGRTGAEVFFDYERTSGRYIPKDEDGNEMSGDHRQKNWLENINN
jgi:hypothetical protein|tara:strand:+ start:1216 stop:3084 length:1869 start_codon:yes stop_codon:yes gene_type:complete